ncbi:hypothetical protein JW905_04230 [bacterium]|nr:hypothetical protein [candidate division CSSED10-310 bacterium]
MHTQMRVTSTRIVVLAGLLMLITSTSPAIAITPVPASPFPTPTATPTAFPPGVPYIVAHVEDIDDTAGACTDGDGWMDAGEEIQLTVVFSNEGTTFGDNCRVEVSTDNPLVSIAPAAADLGFLGMLEDVGRIFHVTVDAAVQCDEEVHFIFSTEASYGGTWWPSSTVDSYHLELDFEGGITCDDTPCGATPTPTPTAYWFSPTPHVTETCLPCLPLLTGELLHLDDDAGQCSDADGLPDAGERVILTMDFYNDGSCAGEDCYVTVSAGNPLVTIQPLQAQLGVVPLHGHAQQDFQLTVSGHAECGAAVTLSFTAYGYYCGSWFDWPTILTLPLEIDLIDGSVICDTTACGATELGVILMMPGHCFAPGDPCRLDATLTNPGPVPLYDLRLAILLDSGLGLYWCYPSWCALPPQLDAVIIETLPLGNLPVSIIPAFNWPETGGHMGGLGFYGALLDPDMSRLVGELDYWPFEY